MSSFFGKLKSQVCNEAAPRGYLCSCSEPAPSCRRPASVCHSTTDGFLPQNAPSPAVGTAPTKKDPNAPVPTPLERMLMNAGPIRHDGSDKFFGMENVRLPSLSESRSC